MDPELNPVIASSLHHFAITTGKLEDMKDWYANVLGAMPVVEIPGVGGATKTVWLSYGEANYRIILTAVDGLEPSEKKPAAHLRRIAFAFPNMDDMLNSYARLNSLGVIPAYAADHGAVTSFYYEDPDGNVLELTVDNFKTPAECVEFLQSPAFAANPLGTPVEPDKMVIQRSEGMSIEELHQRGYAGEFPPYKAGNPGVVI
jgi:catechol 2,3-dioxygenase